MHDTIPFTTTSVPRAFVISPVLLILRGGSPSAAPTDKFTFELDVTCPDPGESFVTVEMDSRGLTRFIKGDKPRAGVASFEGEVIIDGVAYPIEFSPS